MTFTALAIPSEFQNKLAVYLDRWRLKFPGTQWVHPADYHITLRFLGGLTKEQIRPLQAGLALSFPGELSLELKAPGSFVQGPKAVLFIGLATIPPELKELQQRLEARAQALGLPAERRPYHPHLTVGRIQGEAALGHAKAWEREKELSGQAMIFRDYRLMKRLSGARDGQDGPKYETLAIY